METLKNKLAKSSSKLLLLVGLLTVFNLAMAAPVWAADPCHDPNATEQQIKDQKCCDKKTPTSATLKNCLKINPIIKDINVLVNFLSAAAGIVIVGSIIVGGIQYSAAGNNPNAVSAAKKRITDALIALLAFFFIFGFLQWLIPGGLLFS
jgi:hypothetical protein